MAIRVTYEARGKRSRDPAVIAREIERGINDGAGRWLEGRRQELLANTGEIWPYLTGASSRGFLLEERGEGAWSFENTMPYAPFLERRGAYVERLLGSRNAQLEADMQAELREV